MKIIYLILIIASVAFASCSNGSDDHRDQAPIKTDTTKVKIAPTKKL